MEMKMASQRSTSQMDETFNWHRVPGCSALPSEVVAGSALAELLDAAEDMKRFMAT